MERGWREDAKEGGEEAVKEEAYQLRWWSSSSSISSLMGKFDLRLEVWRGVKVAARVPGALPLYEIHTNSDRVVGRVHRHIVRRVGKAALRWCPTARGTLKLPTYLQIDRGILRQGRRGRGCRWLHSTDTVSCSCGRWCGPSCSTSGTSSSYCCRGNISVTCCPVTASWRWLKTAPANPPCVTSNSQPQTTPLPLFILSQIFWA